MKDEFKLYKKHEERLEQLEETTNWLYQQIGFSNNVIRSLKVKRLNPDAKLPTLAYKDPAGYDLYANKDVTVGFHEIRGIGTGLAMEIPEGYVGIIKERGSTPEMGFHIHSGVIDPDFRNEVKIVVSLNQYGKMWGAHIDKGQKIAQMVILRKLTPPVVEVDELSDTERGKKGFGSSDD